MAAASAETARRAGGPDHGPGARMRRHRPGGRVVMQRPAKPCTPVRFRPRPPSCRERLGILPNSRENGASRAGPRFPPRPLRCVGAGTSMCRVWRCVVFRQIGLLPDFNENGASRAGPRERAHCRAFVRSTGSLPPFPSRGGCGWGWWCSGMCGFAVWVQRPRAMRRTVAGPSNFLPPSRCGTLRTQRPDGETGRRKGLKIPRPRGHAGSIPAPGTSPAAVAVRRALRYARTRNIPGGSCRCCLRVTSCSPAASRWRCSP